MQQSKQMLGHNTFFGTVGFAVEGATATSSSAVSTAVWHGHFLGHCFFLPFAFNDHFLLAGMVFDGSESASCKKYKTAIHCQKGWNYLFVRDLNLITLVTLIR